MKNIWNDDQGFVWILAVSLLALISTQLTVGMIYENHLTIRIGFFLFTIIAVYSSSLRKPGKYAGYTIASALMIMALLLMRNGNHTLILVFSTISVLYMLFSLSLVIIQIFDGGTITTYKIVGGIASYVLLGLLWATIYLTIYMIDPAAFQYGGELIREDHAVKHLSYFSFVTLTTIGYGDITAISDASHLFVMLEGLTGQLFPAIFIAKLVALQIEHSRR